MNFLEHEINITKPEYHDLTPDENRVLIALRPRILYRVLYEAMGTISLLIPESERRSAFVNLKRLTVDHTTNRFGSLSYTVEECIDRAYIAYIGQTFHNIAFSIGLNPKMDTSDTDHTIPGPVATDGLSLTDVDNITTKAAEELFSLLRTSGSMANLNPIGCQVDRINTFDEKDGETDEIENIR